MGKKRKEEKSIENPASNEGIPQTRTYDNPINALTPVPAEADPANISEKPKPSCSPCKLPRLADVRSRPAPASPPSPSTPSSYSSMLLQWHSFALVVHSRGALQVIRGHPLASIFFLEAHEYEGYPKKVRKMHAVVGFMSLLTAAMFSILSLNVVGDSWMGPFICKGLMYILDAASLTPCIKWRARMGGLGKKKNLCMEKWLHVWGILVAVGFWIWLALNLGYDPETKRDRELAFPSMCADCSPSSYRTMVGRQFATEDACRAEWCKTNNAYSTKANQPGQLLTTEANLDALLAVVMNYLVIEQVETLFAFLTGAAGILDAFNIEV